MRELITTSKKKKEKKKKRRQGMNGRTFSPNPRKRGKSHHEMLMAAVALDLKLLSPHAVATPSQPPDADGPRLWVLPHRGLCPLRFPRFAANFVLEQG